MLDHVDFNAPEPPRLFVSPKGNLLYASSIFAKTKYRVKGLSWWKRFAPWAGEEGVRIIF